MHKTFENIVKLRAILDARALGAAGDGVTDDSAVFVEVEAMPGQVDVDLRGQTYLTALAVSDFTKNYYNGTVIGINIEGHSERIRCVAPVYADEIRTRGTKSPIAGNWAGLKVLWLGTSIPQQGVGVDGYPELFGSALDCTVTNNAWSGSHATYDVTASATDIITVKALSMTEDDRVAGLALHGAGCAYDDSFDLITKASQMTCDYRIKTPFVAAPFDVVVLDHAHNDRRHPPGTLTPESLAITAIVKGATTTVTVTALGSLAVGNAVALEVTGIASLNDAAARVQAIAGLNVTLNIDSSGYAGVFASGTLRKLDRNTICGALEFLIYYIKNLSARYGSGNVKIILASAPSHYTHDEFDNSVSSSAKYIEDVAAKWGLAFFDIATRYDVKLAEQLTYFTDGIHPLTTETRQALANHWIAWACGGAPIYHSPSKFLPKGGTSAFVAQREALYSKFMQGFATPAFIVGDPVTVLTENFAAGLGTWAANGTAPVFGAAPWGGGQSALQCVSTAGAPTSYLSQGGLATDAAVLAQFDLWLPAVSGLTSGATKTVELLELRDAANAAYYVVELLVHETSCELRPVVFQVANDNLYTFGTTGVDLQAATRHTVRLEAVRAAAGYPGALLLYLDDQLVSLPANLADSAQTNPANIRVGVITSNLAANLTVWIGNLLLQKNAVSDYSARFSGAATADMDLTVVNGIITAAVANAVARRAALDVEQAALFRIMTADANGQNSNAAQQIFPAQGAVALEANTTYLIKALYNIHESAAATTAHTIALGFAGTATLTAIVYAAIFTPANADVTQTTQNTTLINTAASTVASPSNTTGDKWFVIEGMIETNAAGTLIPQFTFSVAPGAVPTIRVGTYFRLTKVGAGNVAAKGTWT